MTDYEDMPVDDDRCDSARWGGRLITSMKPLRRLPRRGGGDEGEKRGQGRKMEEK